MYTYWYRYDAGLVWPVSDYYTAVPYCTSTCVPSFFGRTCDYDLFLTNDEYHTYDDRIFNGTINVLPTVMPMAMPTPDKNPSPKPKIEHPKPKRKTQKIVDKNRLTRPVQDRGRKNSAYSHCRTKAHR